MSPAKTVEQIEMPFGMWARMGPHNHVLDGGLDPPGEGTILGVGIHVHASGRYIFNKTMLPFIEYLRSLVKNWRQQDY